MTFFPSIEADTLFPSIWPTDEPRARRTDPISSHVAADKSAPTRGRVHEAVVWILTTYGPRDGHEINDLYRVNQALQGWPLVAADSPRKRAAELVGTRLVVTNPDDPRGTPHIYALAVTP